LYINEGGFTVLFKVTAVRASGPAWLIFADVSEEYASSAFRVVIPLFYRTLKLRPYMVPMYASGNTF
jgi:hypothetical protein